MASIPREQWTRAASLYSSGLPMRAVAERFGTTINAVTYVLRRVNAPRRSAREASRIAFAAKKPSFSVRMRGSNKLHELQVAGAMLYWAEGYRSPLAQGVDFANSDPHMVELFVKFLRTRYILEEPRFRAFIYCYANQDIPSLITYWSRLLGIPKKQFTKPHVRDVRGKTTREMPYGLIHIRYSDKKLLLDILNLIESYRLKHCAGGRAVNYDAL